MNTLLEICLERQKRTTTDGNITGLNYTIWRTFEQNLMKDWELTYDTSTLRENSLCMLSNSAVNWHNVLRNITEYWSNAIKLVKFEYADWHLPGTLKGTKTDDNIIGLILNRDRQDLIHLSHLACWTSCNRKFRWRNLLRRRFRTVLRYSCIHCRRWRRAPVNIGKCTGVEDW